VASAILSDQTESGPKPASAPGGDKGASSSAEKASHKTYRIANIILPSLHSPDRSNLKAECLLKREYVFKHHKACLQHCAAQTLCIRVRVCATDEAMMSAENALVPSWQQCWCAALLCCHCAAESCCCWEGPFCDTALLSPAFMLFQCSLSLLMLFSVQT